MIHSSRARGIIVVALSLAISVLSANWYTHGWVASDLIVPNADMSMLLSEYNDLLLGSPGDTGVFFFVGDEPGGTLLVVGGAHPDEPASTLAAMILADTIKVTKGRVIIIPYANASGFTHNQPQEAHPPYYHIPSPNGAVAMKYGSRLTNPVHQWPDPMVYVEPNTGQKLSGSESRNLNRAYPGIRDGSLTSRIAFAITSLILQEDVDVAIDLHESSPEYPVNNAIVAHERAMDIAAIASLDLELIGVEIGIEPSPVNLRGLSHREWGEATKALAFLLESTNPAQGRLRGRTDENLIVDGLDRMYIKASGQGRLFVPYDEGGKPIHERAARHVASVKAIVEAYSMMNPDREIVFEGVPDYADIIRAGAGAFLALR